MSRTKLAKNKTVPKVKGVAAKKQVIKKAIAKSQNSGKKKTLNAYKKEELAILAKKIDHNLSEEDLELYSKRTLANIAGVQLKPVKFNPKKIKNNYFYISRAALFRLVKKYSLKKLYPKIKTFRISAKFLDNLNDVLLSQMSAILADSNEITLHCKRETTTGRDVILSANIKRLPWVATKIENFDFPLSAKANREIKAMGIRRLATFSGIKRVSGCNYESRADKEPTFYEAVSFLYATLLLHIIKECSILIMYSEKKTFSTKELNYVCGRMGANFYEKN